MSEKQLKRILSAVKDVKLKRTYSFDSRRKPQYNPPLPRKMRKSGKVDALVGGVVVAGPQGPERKKYDNQVSQTAVTNVAPYIASLTSGIAEGLQANQRIGGRAHLKNIDVEINWSGNSSGALLTLQSVPVYMDVMLVWDKQPDGAVPTVGTIFTGSSTNLVFGLLANIERFQVLKRERLNMDVAAGYSGVIHWHQQLDCATRYADTTGSPTTNDFYIVAVTGAPGGAAPNFTPAIGYIARVTFTDE